ncbi:putative peptidase [Rhabdobacter roseus]|uniref:Putative peptidase n=1 Tax=Rhabdobacter roseus TaxID=1655419 RepID=A0A840TSK9_9BACT|nr:prolyl oligopeptidase family serine peptidase [Rhabdobacter roseus]MBB5284253.1 putative peptidase [Rhabdobacter roseus]
MLLFRFVGGLLVVLSLLTRPLCGQSLEAFEKREYSHANGQTLPYRILYPANYDRSQKYPLVLLLHGGGERGTDNEKQLAHGAKLFVAQQADFPAIVVAPQCPPESYWSSVKIDRSTAPITLDFDYAARPMTWPLEAALALVKELSKKEAVDKNRLYITGLSMGGMGTFEAISRQPKLFAAAAPICGGGDTTYCDRYVQRLPFWIFHGDADQVVGVAESRRMYRTLQQKKARVKYTEYPGVNHNSWDNAFAEPEYLPWLFGQSKKKKR